MSVSTYFRPNIHQNGPEILGVKVANFFSEIPCVIWCYVSNVYYCHGSDIHFSKQGEHWGS
jgi:hypothetical protein